MVSGHDRLLCMVVKWKPQRGQRTWSGVGLLTVDAASELSAPAPAALIFLRAGDHVNKSSLSTSTGFPLWPSGGAVVVVVAPDTLSSPATMLLRRGGSIVPVAVAPPSEFLALE
uniref:Uncharacterized protein n=1 Tax=Zea mays TaxID=4577 RepID=A0A804Q793_MAIZE